MKAIIKTPDERIGHVAEIENTLEALQQIVGGYIETVLAYSANNTPIIIICDEEGRLKGKPHNCTADRVSFVGTIVVLGEDGEDFCDCPISLDEWDKMLLRQKVIKRGPIEYYLTEDPAADMDAFINLLW